MSAPTGVGAPEGQVEQEFWGLRSLSTPAQEDHLEVQRDGLDFTVDVTADGEGLVSHAGSVLLAMMLASLVLATTVPGASGSTSTAARAGSEAMSSADDAGRLGLWAYTYFHLPLIAGIVVVAVGRRACGQPPGCRRDDNHNRGDPRRNHVVSRRARPLQMGALTPPNSVTAARAPGPLVRCFAE